MIRLFRSNTWSTSLGVALVAVSLSACQAVRAPLRPAWLSMPKDEDGVFFYVDGHATGAAGPEEARASAFADAQRQIEAMLLAGHADGNSAHGALPLTQTLVIPDATYVEPLRSGYQAWVRVSFPQTARDRLLRRLEAGDRINARWQEALRLSDRTDYGEAVRLMGELLPDFRNEPLFTLCTEPQARTMLKDLTAQQIRKGREQELERLWSTAQAAYQRQQYQDCAAGLQALLNVYEPDPALGFTVEQAKLLLGQVVDQQKDALEARRWYEDVLKSGQEPWAAEAAKHLSALPPPPRLWPMHDRWRGQKVALVCALRDGGSYRRFGDLVNILSKDLRDARLQGVDLTERLDGRALDDLFARQTLDLLKTVAAGEGAGIVLAVGFEIDPSKRGQQEEHFGAKFPVVDSTVRYLVIEPSIGFLSCSDQFKEIAGESAEVRLADRAATILIQKYLIPHCAAVP